MNLVCKRKLFVEFVHCPNRKVVGVSEFAVGFKIMNFNFIVKKLIINS